MILRFISDLLSPRSWLIAATVVLFGWAAVGYHQDQLNATLILNRLDGAPTTAAADSADFTALRRSLLGISFLLIAMAALSSLPIWNRIWAPWHGTLGHRRAPRTSRRGHRTGPQDDLTIDDIAPLVPRRRVWRLVSRMILGPDEPGARIKSRR